MSSTTEMVDIVDEQDRVVGQASRAQMRRENLLHRNVAVLCVNSAGQIYVHRRADTKDLFPGLYDYFVSGVVSAGEHYEDAARRELAEELGIMATELTPLFHHRYEGSHTRSHTAVFRVFWDGAITHQASEITWGGFRPREAITDNHDGWVFVPDGTELFLRYLAEC